MTDAVSLEAITHDTLLNGKVSIFQPRKGYRAGMDAIVLASMINIRPAGKALDVGAGVGSVSFCVASRCRDISVTAIEADRQMAALAEKGIEQNGFQGRIICLNDEVLALSDPAFLKTFKDMENTYDVVFSNPPYFDASRIKAPDEARQAAYIEKLSLEEWLKFMLYCAKPKAEITLIHRAEALGDILRFLGQRAGRIKVTCIHPETGKPAKRIIVSARKGLRAGQLMVTKPLILYEKASNRTETADFRRILAGGAF